MVPIILVALTVLLNIAAQVVLKISSGSAQSIFGFINQTFFAACLLYGFGLITWTLALKSLPLSSAYPFMALATLGVPLAGFLFLGETITAQQWGFLALVLVGLVGFSWVGAK